MAEELIAHGGSGVRSWAVASDDLGLVASVGKKQGLTARPIIDMNRTTPEGVRLDWQICFLLGHRLLPFFIDWKKSPHPAQNTPRGCTLADFTVSLAEPAPYRALMDALGIEVTIESGPERCGARLQTPTGLVALPSW